MTVTIEPDIFDLMGEPFEDGWTTSPVFLVLSPDQEGAAKALHAAGKRFMLVDVNGDELECWEAFVGETYTPNYVSDVHVTDSGLWLSVDTKGDLSGPMAATMLRILVEELLSQGVTAHVTAPPEGDDPGDRVWQPLGSEAEEPEEEGPRAWYVCRTVWSKTTTGKSYQDCEYRHADGTWGRDRSRAEAFTDEPPLDLADRLREENEVPGVGPVTIFQMSMDDRDPWPMPPISIRQTGMREP